VVLLYLIPGTGCTLLWQEWIIVGGWILLGAVFYIWSKIRYKDKFATNIDTLNDSSDSNIMSKD